MPGTGPGGRGRFPGFDVMREAGHWDDETLAVVVARQHPDPVRFFDVSEQHTAATLLDRLLNQEGEPRVPVLELVDARLLAHEGDGYRYADMPEDWDAWKRSLAGLDADADAVHGTRFADVALRYQKDIIESVRHDRTGWHGMPGPRVFSLWMRYALTAFYSHPLAWNEIGFPGPAYPRGYKTLAVDRREPFEVAEHDPRDPIPWLRKAEAARAVHQGLPEPRPGERSGGGQE